MNNFAKLKDLVLSLEGDFDKFYDKHNAAAGTRVRKGMQELKTMAQTFRTEVQNMKNTADAPAPAKKAAPAAAKKAAPAAAKKAAPAAKKAAPAAAKKAAPAKKK
ncbi:membrane protease subunit (stomatin/prohibitin family) [Hymenobacter sp. 9A]|uniref:Membrane protease subunit (Stomatin/prohibitin family) n=1 Tax=Hymenobacter caeli TaxID=2735894 RepID=A0ABX2FS09_9BACT|nr:membrane protease subunit (stomatin/prohibitin family) [Hymenobacter caeli]